MKNNFRILLNLLLIAGVIMILTSSCKKSEDNTDPTQSSTFKDIDGNAYTTITIGTQVWMAENLKTTRYRNGDPIPNVTDNEQWNNLTTGAYCNYNNDEAIGNKYGKLYNWYAVIDSRNIAPTGWHLPTEAEWTMFDNYIAANLGTSGSVDKALATKTDWVSSNVLGAPGNDLTKNNTSGFSALPGGYRSSNNTNFNLSFSNIGSSGFWWSSNSFFKTDNYTHLFFFQVGSNPSEGRNWEGKDGYSVRCIKD